MYENQAFTKTQLFFLAAMRIAIGWHFLYEGLVKLFNSSWTSSGYLMDSKGFMAPTYTALAADPDVLNIVDHLNEWGLILIGLGLILGLFTRLAIISGMVLLVFYYLSHPPFIGLRYLLPSEGSYFVVDKILIEFIALGVLLVFPTGRLIGIDGLIFRGKVKT